MAVINASALAHELRLGTDGDRLHAVCLSAITSYAPGAPDDVKSEALYRMASSLSAYDGNTAGLQQFQVTGGSGSGIDLRFRDAAQSALRASGAAALLSPWRVRRAVRAVAS